MAMRDASQSRNDTREQIAKIAIRLFLKAGVANTSMRDLARAAGFTTGGLYYYFNSKEEIINLVTDVAINSTDQMKEYYRGLGNLSRTEAIKACISYWLKSGDQIQDYLVFYTRETLSIEPGRREAVMQSVRDFVRFFATLFEDGVKAGEFARHDSRLLAFNIWALQSEWALRRWLLRDMFTIDQYIQRQTEIVLKQILKPEKPPANADASKPAVSR